MINRFWDIDNTKTKFKVCNVQTLEMAAILGNVGVDSFGVHYWEKNHSNEAIKKLDWVAGLKTKDISKWILTDCYKSEILQDIFSLTAFDTVQFQGYFDYIKFNALSIKLKASFPFLKIVKSVSSNLKDNNESESYIKAINSCCDGFLFDTGWRGGTGIENNLVRSLKFPQWCKKPIIMAGGINIENVDTILKTLKPNAIDLQSGVEDIFYFGGDKKARVKKHFKNRSHS